MCTMYEKFRRLQTEIAQNRVPEGDDFIDCCIRAGISPSDAEELLQEEQGFDGDEFLRILLK